MRGRAMEDGASRRAVGAGLRPRPRHLSLMLLTFLGLTMATTTSTELQIATNYRGASRRSTTPRRGSRWRASC